MARQRDIYVPPSGPGPTPELSSEIFEAMGEDGINAMLEAFYRELGQSDISDLFGEETSLLVDGLTKVDDDLLSRSVLKEQTYRKQVLLAVRDVRVLCLKFWDRIDNLQTIQALDLEKFERYSRGAGLKIVKIFGDYSLNDFDPHISDRLILVMQ